MTSCVSKIYASSSSSPPEHSTVYLTVDSHSVSPYNLMHSSCFFVFERKCQHPTYKHASFDTNRSFQLPQRCATTFTQSVFQAIFVLCVCVYTTQIARTSRMSTNSAFEHSAFRCVHYNTVQCSVQKLSPARSKYHANISIQLGQ